MYVERFSRYDLENWGKSSFFALTQHIKTIITLVLLGAESWLIALFNHFSMTGRCSGPAHNDVSIWQAARAAFVTSSFKIFLTQTFPRCGATCYIVPSRAMTQLFNGVNFVYRSVEVYLTFCSYLRVLVRIRNFYNGGRY